MTVTRREMLAATAAALANVGAAKAAGAAGAARAAQAAAPAQAAPKFFTAAQFALLDELTDVLIPTDAQSPGARAAGVAAYIDFRLSESLDAEQQASWRSGLDGVDALARELHGKPFMETTPEQRMAVVTRMAAGEQGEPKTPQDRFFRQLKGWTVRAYYTSKIGIHVDQQYKGNVFQRGEYAGYDAK